MLKEILAREEGKTLEFKENTSSLQKIIQQIKEKQRKSINVV